MSARVKVTSGAETPSERLERIMRKAMARGRRAEDRKSRAVGHYERSIASRTKDLN